MGVEIDYLEVKNLEVVIDWSAAALNNGTPYFKFK
jgi:hypothetical protein